MSKRRKGIWIAGCLCLSALIMWISAAMSTKKEGENDSALSLLRNELETYIYSCPADIGVCVIRNNQDTIKVNNHQAYPMNSVMKLYQAAALMEYLQEQKVSLDSLIMIDALELHPNTYSPLRDSIGIRNCFMSIAQLIEFSLRYSDNNACDILFNHILGIDATARHIHNMGIKDFAICVDENTMHQNPTRVIENWNYPSAAAELINRIFTADLFSYKYQSFIQQTLHSCSTGENRLAKPLLGTKAVIGHKTGTGFNDEHNKPQGINDVGFVKLPNGEHYSIAVFVKSSQLDIDATEQMIAAISNIVFHSF